MTILKRASNDCKYSDLTEREDGQRRLHPVRDLRVIPNVHHHLQVRQPVNHLQHEMLHPTAPGNRIQVNQQLQMNISHSRQSEKGTFLSLPSREHTVVLSVQLVSNDLVVGAHPSLDCSSHDVLGDASFKGLQVML